MTTSLKVYHLIIWAKLNNFKKGEKSEITKKRDFLAVFGVLLCNRQSDVMKHKEQFERA